MAINYQRVKNYVDRLLHSRSTEEWIERLRPKEENPAPKVPKGLTPEALEERWKLIPIPWESREVLADSQSLAQMESYRRNIENFIGTAKVPVGLAGP
ncbi:MAG: hypothetical protein HY731_08730, partial [Candidatus Tectomicrobia bacterium]|nr:hypothetical protein [Candidatus Tectomicrobia bacterium]